MYAIVIFSSCSRLAIFQIPFLAEYFAQKAQNAQKILQKILPAAQKPETKSDFLYDFAPQAIFRVQRANIVYFFGKFRIIRANCAFCAILKFP